MTNTTPNPKGPKQQCRHLEDDPTKGTLIMAVQNDS